jgi:hypothetical protein
VKDTEGEEHLRRSILIATILAVVAALPLPAQQNPSGPLSLPIPLARSLHPHPRYGSRPPEQAPEQAPNQASQRATQPDTGPVFDATGLGAPLILDKGWRVGISGDPAAGSPNFDDSQWAVRDAANTIQEISDPTDQSANEGHGSQAMHVQVGPPPARGRFVWFRMHLKLAPNHGSIALLVELPVSRSTAWGIGGSNDTSINVYANGKLIEPEGPHGADPQHYQQISRIYKIDVPPSETALTLAIRTPHYALGFSAYMNFFANRTIRLGHPDDLQRRIMIWNDGTLFERLPRLVYSAVLIVLAGFLFALYFAQPGHNEYLWLALHELAQAPIGFVELSGSTAKLDSLWYAALVLQLLLVSAYLFFEFLISFLGLKRRWYT